MIKVGLIGGIGPESTINELLSTGYYEIKKAIS